MRTYQPGSWQQYSLMANTLTIEKSAASGASFGSGSQWQSCDGLKSAGLCWNQCAGRRDAESWDAGESLAFLGNDFVQRE